MLVELKFLQKVGPKQWRYRRKVPTALRPQMGKWEIVIPLGSNEAQALGAYPAAHKAAEKALKDAARGKTAGAVKASLEPTPLDLFREAQREARLVASDEDRELAASFLADEAEKAAERGVALPSGHAFRYQALEPSAPKVAPDATVEDAKRLYLREVVGTDDKKRMELDRVFAFVSAALEGNRALTSLRRDDAKEVRSHMLDGRKASSVERYLNVVRAVFNHAIKEWDLSWKNPFMGLEAEKRSAAEPDRDLRAPYPLDKLAETTARIRGMAKPELQRIWHMLAGTGARVAEVSGLRVMDLQLDHPTPHMRIVWHDNRRVKTKVSQRAVPLLGDALEAAREALEAAGGGTMLFPSYGREGGPDAASAALGKHVRAVVEDRKVTTHSLRHLMKDRLRLAGVSKSDQDMVLGHASGGVGEDYGGDEVRLAVAERALRAALNMPKG